MYPIYRLSHKNKKQKSEAAGMGSNPYFKMNYRSPGCSLDEQPVSYSFQEKSR
jgi:hypothetical protein